MNTKQVEEQHAKTLADFEQWKTSGGCKLTAEEIIFLCVFFKIDYPKAIYDISYSMNPAHFYGTASGRRASAVHKCLQELSKRSASK